MDIISIKGLSKSFKTRKGKNGSRTVEAVQGIDLSIHEGEIFGFLGPNGAGKTTTLRILSTLLPADDGRVEIAGHDVRTEPVLVRKAIGYVSQTGGTDPDCTGRENLILQAGLYGITGKRARQRVEELIQALSLTEFVDRFAKTYSGGQKRKLDIAIGMVASPPILFLDEPTTGLDPVSRSQLWSQIRLLRKMGTTVFLTTHYLDEADALCDRLAIMDHGRIVSQGSPDELKNRIQGDILNLTVNHAPNAPALAREALSGNEMIREIQSEDGSLRLVVSHGGETLPQVMRLLEGKGVSVTSISLSRPSLDDVFLRATGHSLTEELPVAPRIPAAAAAHKE
jgi:ABC-2 type transport system ATP-binding protein